MPTVKPRKKPTKPKALTVWVSTLIPKIGADTYDGVRVQVSPTERDCYADLAEWLEINYADNEDLEKLKRIVSDGFEEDREGFAVEHWNVQEQTIYG